MFLKIIPYICRNNQTMKDTIETIREEFQFESTEQYSTFNEMAQEFLTRELMEELNQDDKN